MTRAHETDSTAAGTSRVDRDEVAALYEARACWLARLVRRDFRLAHADAEGVVQDAFVALMETRGKLAHPVAWLVLVVRRLAAKRRRALERLVPDDTLALREAPRLDIDVFLDLRRALARLRVRRRHIVALRHLVGWTAAEIAGHCDLEPPAVRQVLSRAMADLRGQRLTTRSSEDRLSRVD